MTEPDVSLTKWARKGCISSSSLVAIHESGHAVVAYFLEMDVDYLHVDLSEDEGGGCVLLGERHAGAPTLERLLVKIAGHIATGDALEWPPAILDPKSTDDETTAAELVRDLDLSEQGWDDANRWVREILAVPQVIRARKALVGALVRHGTLKGAEGRAIYDAAASAARVELEP